MFIALLNIDTDDDFFVQIAGQHIRCAGLVQLRAPTAQAARDAALKAVDEATLTWSKKWSITDSKGTQHGDYAAHWTTVKKWLHESVEESPEDRAWRVGGNQTLELTVFEELPKARKKHRAKPR